MYRTKTCGELNISNVNETVELAGWIQKIRDLGAMIFIDFIISKIPEGKATFLLNLRNQKLILIPAAIALILLIVSANQDTYGLGKLAFGFYLLLIGIIALVAYPFMYKGE